MTSLLTWNQLGLGCIIKKPRQVSDFRSIQIEFFGDKVEREQAKRSKTKPVALVWKPADPAQREAGRRHSFDCNVMPHLFPWAKNLFQPERSPSDATSKCIFLFVNFCGAVLCQVPTSKLAVTHSLNQKWLLKWSPHSACVVQVVIIRVVCDSGQVT